MRSRLSRAAAVLCAIFALASCSGGTHSQSAIPSVGSDASSTESIARGGFGPTSAAAPTLVVNWNNVALQAIRDTHPGPPMAARMLAIVNTCIYDSWAAYDARAVGTRLGGSLRRVSRERDVDSARWQGSVPFAASKSTAISYAAYRALVDLFPGDTGIVDGYMRSLGYDPANTTTDVTTPAGIGNVACGAVLAFRHHDGSNQLGDLNPGAYSDYTGYRPVNTPTHIVDPNLWQPLCVPQPSGPCVQQTYVAPFWGQVKPFALRSVTEFVPPTPPARYGERRYVEQAEAILDLSAGLTDEQKIMAEYWANGPHTELPPGHWNLFASYVSARDRHTLDDDVKMFFAESNAIFDAGIVAWGVKRIYTSERPVTAIHYLFTGKPVRAWAGPNLGTQTIDGGTWQPYQLPSAPTPPFPEYFSGHSAFSAAGAAVLRMFTGSDAFGASYTALPHTSVIESNTPATTVTLHWNTFTDAANQAGISRRYGGIHFEQGDLDARAAGRLVGENAYRVAQTYINGTAR